MIFRNNYLHTHHITLKYNKQKKDFISHLYVFNVKKEKKKFVKFVCLYYYFFFKDFVL